MSTAPTTLAVMTPLPAGRIRAGAVALLCGVALSGLGQVVHGPEVSPSRDFAEYVAAMSTTRLATAHLAAWWLASALWRAAGQARLDLPHSAGEPEARA